MSDNAPVRGISYLDGAMVSMGVMFTVGLAHARFTTSPFAWTPLAALALWLVARRRPHRMGRLLTVAAVAMLPGVALLFWRWGLAPFVAAMTVTSLLLIVGLVLGPHRLAALPSRRDLIRVMVVCASLLLTVALTEGVLRLVPGVLPPQVRKTTEADRRNYGVAHPYIGHLHHPSADIELSSRDFHAIHHVDALGFRNHWPWPAPADIVVVGDSLTFGYGVSDENAWPAMVAQAISPRGLVNLGLIGAGPEQYGRVYETFGVALRPKLLLVALFGQNDFWDAGMFDRWLQSGTEPNYMVWRDFGQTDPVVFNLRAPVATLTGFVRAVGYQTLRRSYLFNLLRTARAREWAGVPREVRFADGGRLELLAEDFEAKRARAQPGQPEFRIVVAALERIAALAAQHGTRVVVVLQPGKEEVYLPLLGERPSDTTSALRPELEQRGIEYLDLGPAFRAEAAAGARLFYEFDGHPNARGYALTAELVKAYVTEHAGRLGLAVASRR
jgi:lysophospholipase L1-like esterase